MGPSDLTPARPLAPDDFIVDAPERASPSLRSLSIVVPVLNEALTIDALASQLTAVLDTLGNPYEVIIVDDGSTDGTLDALRALHKKNANFRAISFSRNFGKEIAVAAGLAHATGDGAVIMDGDLQHPPETIRRFVELWDRGYDNVYGQRTDRSQNTTLEKYSARAFYRLFRNLSGTELPDGAGDFRLLDRRVIDVFNKLDERARFNKGLFAWVGFRSIGVPFEVAARVHGSTRWHFRRLLRFAVDGIASFTTVPLKIWSYVGIMISLVAFIYALYFLLKTLILGVDVPGFPSLLISVLLLGGIQLISLGVIGEYLGRVYEEVKGRPLYIISESVGFDRRTAGGQDTAPRGRATS
ncbi:MAG: glycosyltransferase family 2 protein [Hyphomicrobiaceae bacterium]